MKYKIQLALGSKAKENSHLNSTGLPMPKFVNLESSSSGALKNLIAGNTFTAQFSDDGNHFEDILVTVVGDGRSLLVGNEILHIKSWIPNLKRNEKRLGVGYAGKRLVLEGEVVKPVAPKKNAALQTGPKKLKSPISGKLVKIGVTTGQRVEEGQVLCVIEAMKMENQILADANGTITHIHVTENTSVSGQDILITILQD